MMYDYKKTMIDIAFILQSIAYLCDNIFQYHYNLEKNNINRKYNLLPNKKQQAMENLNMRYYNCSVNDRGIPNYNHSCIDLWFQTKSMHDKHAKFLNTIKYVATLLSMKSTHFNMNTTNTDLMNTLSQMFDSIFGFHKKVTFYTIDCIVCMYVCTYISIPRTYIIKMRIPTICTTVSQGHIYVISLG